jgi:hypothetical protein
MKIHQLSVNYLLEQDRILVRLNTQGGDEIRLWLTRRLMLTLWPTLNREVAEHVARQASVRDTAMAALANADDQTKQLLADFSREDVLRDADFKTPFNPKPGHFPLGERPLLVTGINIKPLETGRLELGFQEKLPGRPHPPRGFRASPPDPMLHSLVHLLQKALARSGWDPARFGDAPAEDRKAPEPGSGTDKPKYLN